MVNKGTLLKLKQQERQIRQGIIVDAAREVFGRKTFDTVSMSEIAEAAGMAKSSIYTYFKNQEELYAQIACRDAEAFIHQLAQVIKESPSNPVGEAIRFFVGYYVQNKAQWRMVTHFALHGNRDMAQLERLNRVGRKLMDVFESLIKAAGCQTDTRLMSHTLFAALSGILIAFRNYPGRTEEQRLSHMQKIGRQVEAMIRLFVENG